MRYSRQVGDQSEGISGSKVRASSLVAFPGYVGRLVQDTAETERNQTELGGEG